ncbi:MAG: putative quinol monooxygenase, partial [Bacteroidota bacterium]
AHPKTNTMAIHVIIEVHTQEGKAEALLEVLKQILPETSKHEGFISIDTLQQQDAPNTIIMAEVWASKAHYEAYLQWRTDRGDMDALASFLAEPPSIRYFEKQEAQSFQR